MTFSSISNLALPPLRLRGYRIRHLPRSVRWLGVRDWMVLRLACSCARYHRNSFRRRKRVFRRCRRPESIITSSRKCPGDLTSAIFNPLPRGGLVEGSRKDKLNDWMRFLAIQKWSAIAMSLSKKLPRSLQKDSREIRRANLTLRIQPKSLRDRKSTRLNSSHGYIS